MAKHKKKKIIKTSSDNHPSTQVLSSVGGIASQEKIGKV